MAQSLGERIKTLRKELKMTQTNLSGSEMTKSMLSQIENNLATPSMKNLQYLASRLGRSAAYFLEDGAYLSSLPIEEIHKELKEVSQLNQNVKSREALQKLESMLEKYNFDQDSKLYADFLSKYGECLITLSHSAEGEEKLREAVNIYKNKFLFVDAARTYIILSDIYWNSFDYPKCLDILEEALEIYNDSINRDYSFEIETFYLKSVLYAGLDKLEDSIEFASQALNISKQTNIYFKSDELHKNLAIMNGFLGNLEDFDKNIEKARQFAIFTENNVVLSSIEGACGLYCNQKNQPEKAIEYLEKALKLSEQITAFANTEKAKSLYILKKYQLSLDTLKFIEYPQYTPFKYDYLHIWSSKIYKGLILNKLGKSEQAIEAIKIGIEKIEIVGESKVLAFAYKSLSEVYSDMEDFENAFATLKKSNELEEFTKDNKLYY